MYFITKDECDKLISYMIGQPMHIAEPVVNFLRGLKNRTESLIKKQSEEKVDKLKIEEIKDGNTKSKNKTMPK